MNIYAMEDFNLQAHTETSTKADVRFCARQPSILAFPPAAFSTEGLHLADLASPAQTVVLMFPDQTNRSGVSRQRMVETPRRKSADQRERTLHGPHPVPPMLPW